MARIDVTKKRKTTWPYVLGLILLALAAWGITVLLTDDEEEGPEVEVATVEDTLPPAAIPSPPEAVGSAGPTDLLELMPITEDDIGQPVLAAGEVVATGSSGFWLLVDESTVVRVDSDRQVRRGESASVRGRLEAGDAERAEQIASEVLERRSGDADWSVLQTVKIVEEAQQSPAQQQVGAERIEQAEQPEVPTDG